MKFFRNSLKGFTMKTIIAACLLIVSSSAFGQIACPLCTPGTTPLYYRITFAGTKDDRINGRTFLLRQEGQNTWVSEHRDYPITPADVVAFDTSRGPWRPPLPDGGTVTFFHAGSIPIKKIFAGYPGKGMFTANMAGLKDHFIASGTIATPGERDGNGPFIIPLPGGGTATVRP